jgi:hypothetical protein
MRHASTHAQYYGRSFPAYSIHSGQLDVKRRCRYRYGPDVLWLVVSLSMDSETVRQTRTQRQS